MAVSFFACYSLRRTLWFFLLIPVLSLSQSLAGLTQKTQEVEVTIAEDSLGRQTPRGAVNGYFKAVSAQNFQRASQFLSLSRSQRSKSERKRIVLSLQRMLDQGGELLPESFISQKPEGRTDDDLGPETDLVGTLASKDQPISLYVENTGSATAPVWKFSSHTISQVLAVKGKRPPLLDRILPDSLKDNLIAGVPLGHWLALVVLIVVAYLVSWAVVSLFIFLMTLIWRKPGQEKANLIIHSLNLPARLYLSAWVFVFLSQQVGISMLIRQKFSSITLIIGIVAVLVLFWRATEYLGSYSKERFTALNRASAISVTMFLMRAFKIAIVVFGCITILGSLGVDVTTWLAALGIGGIALALGAQKTVENFVGSIMILADQPVRVGDFCRVDDIKGTVEQIGMRSTQLRTAERTVVTIPNGVLAANRIENFQQRDRFYFDPIFRLRLETTPDQIRFLLKAFRELLQKHEQVSPAGLKVRFTDVAAEGYRIEITSYINAPDFDAFQEVQEDLLLQLMDILASSGTGLAVATQRVFMEGFLSRPENE